MASRAFVLDGKSLAEQIRETLQFKLAERRADNDRMPGLCIIMVGKNKVAQLYVRKKEEMCRKLGFEYHLNLYSVSVSERKIIRDIEIINRDPTVDGILVQLPLPKKYNEMNILSAVAPEKDVDGMTPLNLGRLVHGTGQIFPSTSRAIRSLLDHCNIPISGQHVVVVATSNMVGRPLALEFLAAGATVSIVHEFTSPESLEDLVSMADILVVSAGIRNVIPSHWILPSGSMPLRGIRRGGVCIDIGMNVIEVDGKKRFVGDLDLETVQYRAGYIATVPEGVGALIVAMLMENLYELYSNFGGICSKSICPNGQISQRLYDSSTEKNDFYELPENEDFTDLFGID
jgi:methylenetetrahydrofolate dehydrogenase (NADP+) / methenyltetrahydrofolate cyclohydrolase